MTVDGVTFNVAASLGGDGNTYGDSVISFDGGGDTLYGYGNGSAFPVGGPASSDFATLMDEGGVFQLGGNGSGTVTISGLTLGATYLVQIFNYAPGTGDPGLTTMSGSPAVTLSIANGSGGPNTYGEFATGTFTANASTETFDWNGAGSSYTVLGLISVCQLSSTPPTIVEQPVSQNAYTNETISFTVNAIGTEPLSYQWWKGASLLGGQTNATLTISDVQPANAGGYSVVVTNNYGAVTSIVANLTVVAMPIAYENTVLADNPIGYWPLDLGVDTGGIATDLSGNGNVGTYDSISPANEVAGPSAYIPNSVSFNGYSAWVDLSTVNTPLLNVSGTISMEAWVQPALPQINIYSDIFAKGWANNGIGNEIEMSIYNSELFISGREFSYITTSRLGSAPTTNWTHLVSTYDGTNWNLYVNGALVGMDADPSGPDQFTDPWAIGNGTDGGYGRFFTGNICQVALYTNALTPAQVVAHYAMGLYGTTHLAPIIGGQPFSESVYKNTSVSFTVIAAGTEPLSYQWWKGASQLGEQTNATLTISDVQPANAGGYSVVITNNYGAVTSSVANLTVAIPNGYETTVLADNPIGYWPLDLGVDTGGIAADLSGNGNVGTYDSISPANEVAGPSAYIPNSVSFNGFSAFVDLSTVNTPLLNVSGTISMEAWVQPASSQLQQNADIFAKGWAHYLDANEIEMSLVNSDDFVSGRELGNIATSGSVSTTTNWTYLASTYDGTYWNLYVNGVLVGQEADSTGPSQFTDPWAIGNGTDYGAGRFFTGNICQVALYTNALTPEQVVTHYFMGLRNTTNGAPFIATQPASQRVVTNTPATFRVGAAANPLPSYQWYSVIGGVTNPIAGAIGAAYTTAPVQDSDSGNGYFVVVSNSLGSVTSTTAILTAGHMVTASGFLTADEYFGNYADSLAAFDVLYPTASGLPVPDKVEYLNIFNDNADLPNYGGERIFGWFTPPVTGNYIFFEASDDSGALWLSTNSDPANVYEIAQNQAAMDSGNDGPTDWNVTDTGSGEYAYFSTGEWRSDQFELGGGQSAFAYLIGVWSAWPGLNPDGSITLTAGKAYYIEVDHYQELYGQGEAVTYKLAGNPDPNYGDASLLTGDAISASVPDTVVLEPQPNITNIHVSGSTVTLTGNNGLVNAAYNVLTSTNLALPLTNWTVVGSARFDASGNFSSTNTVSAAHQHFYRIQVP